MDARNLVRQVILKTQMHKLHWDSAAEQAEVVTTFGGEYVLRLIGPRLIEGIMFQDYSPVTLHLETQNGESILTVTSLEEQELDTLWSMVRIGGRSADEAARDAMELLEGL